MSLSISNETKVGALTAIAITLLILGFNFLKGNNPMKKSQYLYARFNSIEGLVSANPVICNGLVIGSVYKTEPGDAYLNSVLVTIRISEAILIPKDSRAVIKGNLLSTPVVEIIKGASGTYFQKGDTIATEQSSGFMGQILDQLGPTQMRLNNALGHFDTLLRNTNNVMDANTQVNLRLMIARLSEVSSNLAYATSSLNKLMKDQNNSIVASIGNLEAMSQNLNQGTQNLPAITKNIESLTKQIEEADLKKLIGNMDATLSSLNETLKKLENPDGTIGALMSDRKLYDNLTSTMNSMNLLLQDLRLQPKRYVNVSVFGKKDKSSPLMKPMDEDSVTQEQYRNQQ